MSNGRTWIILFSSNSWGYASNMGGTVHSKEKFHGILGLIYVYVSYLLYIYKVISYLIKYVVSRLYIERKLATSSLSTRISISSQAVLQIIYLSCTTAIVRIIKITLAFCVSIIRCAFSEILYEYSFIFDILSRYNSNWHGYSTQKKGRWNINQGS